LSGRGGGREGEGVNGTNDSIVEYLLSKFDLTHHHSESLVSFQGCWVRCTTNCYCYLERGEDSKAKTDNQRQWKHEKKKMKKYIKSQGKKATCRSGMTMKKTDIP